MNYVSYKEKIEHGTFDFPFAYYHVDSSHQRYVMREHWHPEFEIIRVLTGRFELTCEGETHTAQKGDTLFINAGSIHSGIPIDCVYECVVFDMDFFVRGSQTVNKEIFSQFYYVIKVNTMLGGSPEIRRASDQLFTAFSYEREIRDLLVQGAIFNLFGQILSSGMYTRNESVSVNRKKLKQFRAIIDYIHQHYHEDIDLQSLARQININQNYLCRFFKEIIHRTPMQYINYYRIERACEELTASDKSVTQIALDCGFNDISYFIKVFKKYKGMTPTQFTKSTDIK